MLGLTLLSLPLLSPAAVLRAEVPASTGQEAAQRDLSERLALLAQQLEERREELHVPGLAVAIVRDDEIVFARGFGLANVEEEQPVTPETIFAIGSSTKAFTATLVGMLADEGKLGLDEPITTYLPDFRLPIRSADPDAFVCLRDLLAHRTGFSRGDLLWAGGKADADTILETILHAEPWTGFREEFHYNNIMFLAAGEACAKVAGKSWGELVAERILEPLGMESTTVRVAEAQKDPRLALGYRWDEDEGRFEHVPMRVLDSVGPAGAINSNVLDMAQWMRFQLQRGELGGRRLIRRETHDETWRKQIEVSAGVGYGLGWFLRTWRGEPVVEHGGNIDGFGAQVALCPDSRVGYVLLANVTATPLQAASMELVWEALLGEAAAEAPAPGDRAAYLGKYVADFAHFADARFTVLEKDGKLAVDVPGQMTFTLKEPDAAGKWTFELTSEIALSFDRDAEGAVVGMKMYQSGLTFELPREGVETPVEIDLDEARRYLGKYHDPALQAELSILIRNNRLAVDIPEQMICELHAPDAEGKRALRVNAALALRFDEGDDGSISGLTFFERGTERVCPRVAGGEEEAPLLDMADLHALRRSAERSRALAALGAYRMAGPVRMVHAGITGSLTSVAAGNDRYALRIDLEPFVTMAAGYDRGLAATVSSIGAPEVHQGPVREKMRVEHPSAVLGDWREFFQTLEVLRSDELDGRKVWVVRLAAGDDVELTAWVDAETGDTLREDTFDYLPDSIGKLPKTTRYSDFRAVEGVRIPFRTESENDATGRTVFDLESFEAHLELPDEAFRITPPGEDDR